MAAKRVGRPKGSKNAVDVVVERSHPAAVASATLAGQRRRPAPSAAAPAAASTGAGSSRSAPAFGPTAHPTVQSSAAAADVSIADRCGSTRNTCNAQHQLRREAPSAATGC